MIIRSIVLYMTSQRVVVEAFSPKSIGVHSNILLLGGRGSGKTHVLKRLLTDLNVCSESKTWTLGQYTSNTGIPGILVSPQVNQDMVPKQFHYQYLTNDICNHILAVGAAHKMVVILRNQFIGKKSSRFDDLPCNDETRHNIKRLLKANKEKKVSLIIILVMHHPIQEDKIEPTPNITCTANATTSTITTSTTTMTNTHATLSTTSNTSEFIHSLMDYSILTCALPSSFFIKNVNSVSLQHNVDSNTLLALYDALKSAKKCLVLEENKQWHY
jgi:hypothetical protein